MRPEYIFRIALTVLFLTAAAAVDIKTKKIPNRITFPMMLIGVAEAVLLSPWRIPTLGISVVILAILSYLPGIGMGDIKLLMGMCCWADPVFVLMTLALASIFVVVTQLIHTPYLTIWQITYRRIRPLRKKEAQEKTESNSVPFAPYLLTAFILIEGVVLCRVYLG